MSGPVSRVLYPLRGGDHLSRSAVAGALQPPTRGLPLAGHTVCKGNGAGYPDLSPYSVLLRAGLARPACHHAAGGLLHHRFSSTPEEEMGKRGNEEIGKQRKLGN